MFGFFGHPQIELIQEAAGSLALTAPTVRMFGFGFASRSGSNTNNLVRSFFDFDNVNATKADQEFLVGTTTISYSGKPLNAETTAVSGNLSSVTGASVAITPAAKIKVGTRHYFQYLSISALSPVTRKIKHSFPFYDVYSIDFSQGTGGLNGAASASSNNITGTFTLNLDAFPFLDSFRLGDTMLTSITVRGSQSTMVTFGITGYQGALTSLNGTLPASIKYISICNLGSVTSINSFIATAVNCLSLILMSTAGNSYANQLPGSTTLTGTLDCSMMTLLQEFMLPSNAGLTSLVMPLGKTDWTLCQINTLSATASAALNTTFLDNLLASPNLQFLCIYGILNGSATTYSKAIGNTEIASTLKILEMYNNKWSGNITITTAKANLQEVRLGNQSSSNANSHPTVNVSGLTALGYLDITTCNVSSLVLPNTTPSLQNLFVYNNPLDFVVDPTLLGQITFHTTLTSLQIGSASSAALGLTSTNGLGANPDFSALSNLTTLGIPTCKATGTLTLYNGNKLTILVISFNTGLTGITNLTAHTGLTNFTAQGCTSLGITSIPNTFTALATLILTNLPSLVTIDLSGKTTTAILSHTITGNSTLTTVTFPTTTARCLSGGITINNNTSLATVNNLANINYSNTTTSSNVFNLSGNALNMTFPFGTNSFIPNSIQIQNNGMSQANVDATIDAIYQNAALWNTYTAAKSLTINGTNAAASGIYQFSATPSTGKEKIYYLINTKGWSITYN
jgi:hypothetical protein